MKADYKFSEAVEIEKDTYKNVVVEADKLTLTEIEGKWIREQKRLARIEKMFTFKGKRTITKNDKLIKEDDVVLYREKKDGEKGVVDINGVEQPYVPQEMVDATDEVLFSHEPCIEDVLQGGLGDCYLIGTIATIVERSPDFIKKMMEEKEDGTVNVRLYDAEGNKVYVNVKKTVPKEYSQGALWVKLIEKAYVVSGLVDGHKKYTESLDRAKEDLKDPNINPGSKRESQRIIDYNTVTNMVTKTADGQAVDTRTARSYNSVEGGEVDLAFKLLTGIQNSDKVDVIDKHLGREDIRQMLKVSKDEVMDTYGEAINDTIKSIEEKQNDPKSKYIFVAGSYPYLFVSGENNDEEANAVRGGIAGPHLYSILGVENVGGKKMIRLRNPWGHGKVHYLKQETTGKEIPVLGDETDAGTFLMHIEDFGSCFRSVSMIDLNKQP